MTILTVGPTSTYASIADALAVAAAGDEISLEAGYGNEDAVVDVDNLFVSGDSSSLNVNLQLGAGIGTLTLLGDAPIHVSDNSGDNTINGNGGANLVEVSGGADVAHGGLGVDRLVVDYSAATASIIGSAVNITDGGTHSVTFDGFENFTIKSGSGNDTLTVGDGHNIIRAGGGNDTLTSGNGQSHIYGGLGNDTITAGDGGNSIFGGVGDDTITAGSGIDLIAAGPGDDTITAGDGDNLVLSGSGNDTITSGSGDDVIKSGLGDDTVTAGGGNDGIFGIGGVDDVNAGAGLDRLTLDYTSSITDVTGGVTGGSLAAGYSGTIADGAGTSSTAFTFVEEFKIKTGSGNDTISTGDGRDTLIGNAGQDTLSGGGGTDMLRGGTGDDVLNAGTGTNDFLRGGFGADTYVYADVLESTGTGHDVINGFNTRVDQFDLDVSVTGVDAGVMSGQLDDATYGADLEAAINSSMLAANHAIIFTPDSGSEAGKLYIAVDANGIAGFQNGQDYLFEIEMGRHMHALSAGDFI